MPKGGSNTIKPPKPSVGAGKPAPKPPKPGIGPGKPAPSPGNLGSNTPVAGPGGGPPPTEVWNPGVPTPTVQPFMTAEDMMAYAQARQQYEEGLFNLDYNYANQVTNATFEKEGIEKGRVKSKAESSDDMAARGLFRSSVRDADLFDIDATAEMRKTFLDTQLNTMKLNNDAQKVMMQGNWKLYEEGKGKKEVENAAGVQASMPAWEIEPHMETIAPPPKPNQNQNKPKTPFQQNQGIKAPGEAKQNTPIPNFNGGTTAPASKNKNSTNLGAAKKVMGKLYG